MGVLIKYLLWGFVFYYLYKFIFGVVVPVGKAANQMKSTVQKMQETQQQQNKQHKQKEQFEQQTKQQSTTKIDADYIEFEEIKEPKH
jgi:uncharacterized protein YybS (DUF2232 family)